MYEDRHNASVEVKHGLGEHEFIKDVKETIQVSLVLIKDLLMFCFRLSCKLIKKMNKMMKMIFKFHVKFTLFYVQSLKHVSKIQ
jgi:hypothetical protein